MFICVAVFLVDRAYGGPEEGGWWFDCGEPADDQAQHTRRFPKRERAQAEAYAEQLRATVLPELNDGRRPVDSVCSEGVYRVVVCKGEPQAYPVRQPCYS